jgi:hypothetical protein
MLVREVVGSPSSMIFLGGVDAQLAQDGALRGGEFGAWRKVPAGPSKVPTCSSWSSSRRQFKVSRRTHRPQIYLLADTVGALRDY